MLLENDYRMLVIVEKIFFLLSFNSFFFLFFGSIAKHSQKRNVSSAPNETTVVPSALIAMDKTRAV